MAVAAAAVAAWAGTLSHGFVYDDHRFVEDNAHLDAVASAPWTAFDPATTTAEGPEPGMWRPLRTLSFALDRALFGADPSGAHLAQVLLHATAAALLFSIGLALRIGDLAAAAAAAIWALHPVQAEAVAWLSSRGDLLATALLLAAVLVHLRRGSAAATVALSALAFLAKESAAAAPLLLAAADLAAGGTARLRERWRPAAAAAGALVVLVGVRAAVLAGAGADAGQGPGLGLGPGETALAIPAMFGWYAVRVLLPRPGTFDHQLTLLVPWAFAGLLAAVAVVSWKRLGLPPAWAGPARAAAAWAVAALLPVTLLQWFLPLKILVADRFLHLALAGPALAAGAALGAFGEGRARAGLAAAPLLLLASLPAGARWASDGVLWTDTLARDPGHPRALYGLAVVREPSEPAAAIVGYRAYLDRVPGDPGAWFRLGLMEERLALAADASPERRGRLLRAAEALGEAIAIWDGGEREGRARGLAEARLARACALGSVGDEVAAEAEGRRAADALRREPPGRRAALRPRAETLSRWARGNGRMEGLVRDLEAATRENGPP